MRRRLLIAAVVVLLVSAGGGAWLLLRPSDAAAAQTMTTTVATGTFQQTVSATGTLAAAREADLDFQVGGRVTSVAVKAGDRVEKGDVLARIDTTSVDAALETAQAQLAAAKAQYTQAVDDDEDDTTVASASAGVAAAESTLDSAQDDVDSATLRATFSGTVTSVGIDVGDEVSGSTGSSSGSSSGSSGSATAGSTGGSTGAAGSSSSTTSSTSSSSAVVIVSPKRFTIQAAVAADDIASVTKGLQAQVTPSGATKAVYGTVTSVGLVAEVGDSGAATFPVVVTLTGTQSGLYAGTSATVAIITKQVTGVLSVPALALHTSGATTYVEKLVGNKQVKQTVTVGETYGASTVVTKGLAAGDKVVLATVRRPSGSGGGTGNQGNQGGEGGLGGNGPPAGGFGDNGPPAGGFQGGGN